jgi:hypothetical protein
VSNYRSTRRKESRNEVCAGIDGRQRHLVTKRLKARHREEQHVINKEFPRIILHQAYVLARLAIDRIVFPSLRTVSRVEALAR